MIHQYINNGYHIIMDVNSGCVHSVDPVMYDGVEMIAKEIPEMEKPQQLPEDLKNRVMAQLIPVYGEQEAKEALEEIQYLIDQEELLTPDQYHDYVVDFKKRKTVVKALCLHIAHDCNLACQYCFAEGPGFPYCQFWKPEKSGSGFLWGRTADELERSKTAGGIRSFQGKGIQQEFPIYHDNQRSSSQR